MRAGLPRLFLVAALVAAIGAPVRGATDSPEDELERAAGEAPESAPEHRSRGPKWPQPAAGLSASGDPEIMFTFDDGPHEDTTGEVLDILQERGIKALFFWTGWRVRSKRPVGAVRRELLARAMAEGHMIGNHTVTHAHLCIGPRDVAEWELDENARLYAPLMQMPLYMVRVPYGSRCKRVEDMLAARGLANLHWDMDPLEWKSASSAETRDYLIKQIKRLPDGRRAVILLHDTKYATVKALPQVLDWLDGENARRVKAGRRPIRIISYVDLAREQIPAPIRAFVDERTAELTSLLPSLGGRLLAPLVGGPPALPAGHAALAPSTHPL